MTATLVADLSGYACTLARILLRSESPIISISSLTVNDLSSSNYSFDLSASVITVTNLIPGTSGYRLTIAAVLMDSSVVVADISFNTWGSWTGREDVSGYTPAAYPGQLNFLYNSPMQSIHSSFIIHYDVSGNVGSVTYTRLPAPYGYAAPSSIDIGGYFVRLPPPFLLSTTAKNIAITLLPDLSGGISITYQEPTITVANMPATFLPYYPYWDISAQAVSILGNGIGYSLIAHVPDGGLATYGDGNIPHATIPLVSVAGQPDLWVLPGAGSGWSTNFFLSYVIEIDVSGGVYPLSYIPLDNTIAPLPTIVYMLEPNATLNAVSTVEEITHLVLKYGDTSLNADTLGLPMNQVFDLSANNQLLITDSTGVPRITTTILTPWSAAYSYANNLIHLGGPGPWLGWSVIVDGPVTALIDASANLYQDPSSGTFISLYSRLLFIDPSGDRIPLDISGFMVGPMTARVDVSGTHYVVYVGNPYAAPSFLTLRVPASGNPRIAATYDLLWSTVNGGFIDPSGRDMSHIFRVRPYTTAVPGQAALWTEYIILGGRAAFPCFLGDAPVLTPLGWRRIDSLRAGDAVILPGSQGQGQRQATVRRLTAHSIAANAETWPYIIRKGQFGATEDLRISPNHRLAIPTGQMLEARVLGLERDRTLMGTIDYFNLELSTWTNMIVAGVEVESQAPLRRTQMPFATFRNLVAAKYGAITGMNYGSSVRMLPDGCVECAVLQTKD